MKADCSLYLCTDRSCLHGASLEEAVEEAICGGVTLVQLREKEMNSRLFYESALRMRAITRRYGVPLLINDRVDIALAADADGVHLGQSDLPARIARQILGPDKIIGVTAASEALAIQAWQDGADYLGSGAVFATSTKKDTKPLPLETLQAICRAVPIPVAAIGGIEEKNIRQLEHTGIAGVAVISAIMGARDKRSAAARLRELSEALFQKQKGEREETEDS